MMTVLPCELSKTVLHASHSLFLSQPSSVFAFVVLFIQVSLLLFFFLDHRTHTLSSAHTRFFSFLFNLCLHASHPFLTPPNPQTLFSHSRISYVILEYPW